MSTQELRIDDEYSRLEQNILSKGCREAIVVWDDIIVDRHNCYKICKGRSIEFQTMQKSFSSREEVIL